MNTQKSASREPLVTVLVFVEDETSHLPEAIRSVQNQTYPHWEMLLIAGSYADAAAANARLLDPRILPVVALKSPNEASRPGSVDGSVGLRGEYVAFLEPDDVWLPGKLEEQIHLLSANPDAVAVFGRTLIWFSWSGDSKLSNLDYFCEMGTATNQMIQPPILLLHTIQNQFQAATLSCTLLRRRSLEMLRQTGIGLLTGGSLEARLLLADLQSRFPVYVADHCWVKQRQQLRKGAITENQLDPARHTLFLNRIRQQLDNSGFASDEVRNALEVELATHDCRSIGHQIARAFPDLRIRSVLFLGEGLHNRAYRVNENLIFRFAKTAKAQQAMGREIQLVALFASRVPLAVPRYEFVAVDPPASASAPAQKRSWKRRLTDLYHRKPLRPPAPVVRFAGYREIPGNFLYPEFVAQASEEIQNCIARQIGEFLVELHSVSPQAATQVGAPERRVLPTQVQSYLTLLESHGTPCLHRDEASSLRRWLDKLKGQSWNYSPCLLHGDLNWDHLLFDTTTHQLTGVIDFGSMFVGDPMCEFVPLWLKYGTAFCRRVIAHYDHSNPDHSLLHIQMHRACEIVRQLGWQATSAIASPDKAREILREFVRGLDT